ncbi:hypothetical protein [Snodgrassella sp. CFCC 13594]|uniref:hypothetical protein n=1 Tax=Snodgrassella sp. CFCC 13594 TaxID=1775559 RepID=UPI00082AC9C1|nr:hypothetical protein [Snodgrassella sp. CFCC 13594]
MCHIKQFDEVESLNASIDAILNQNKFAQVQIRRTERGWELKQVARATLMAKINRTLRAMKKRPAVTGRFSKDCQGNW